MKEIEYNDYIGKKVDIVCDDGRCYAGYLFEHSLPEDSDIGEDSITLAPLGMTFELEIETRDIVSIVADSNYREYT